jgi:septal ring factor EnvC (AmiA/AmiB activator)
LFIFSGLSPAEKITAIDTLYFQDSALLSAFILPLAIALFYVFLFPFPARLIMRFTLYQNRLNRTIRHQILEETVLTLEESRQFIARHKEQVAELEGDANKAQHQVEGWKTEVTRKDQEITELNEELNKSTLRVSALTAQNGREDED